jgi:fumarylacetoacetate (FAA) hydrolase
VRLISYEFPDAESHPRPALLLDEGVLPLPYPGMSELILAGETALEYIRQLSSIRPASALFPFEASRLRAPLPRPSTLRDFYAFEQHVRASHANRGKEIPPEWYQFPVFYFSNPNSIYGPGDDIPIPAHTQALDYELEIACIIGKAGIDIPPEKAEDYIFGYTIFNDWSARDVQAEEMRVGLGPSKGKDFASSLGPWIVTPAEIKDHNTNRPGVFNLTMSARINGVERSRGNWQGLHYSFGEMIARASASAWLLPGDVIASGTVGTGCLLELTAGKGPWLQPGDVVELEIERLGVLTNQIVKAGSVLPVVDLRGEQSQRS